MNKLNVNIKMPEFIFGLPPKKRIVVGTSSKCRNDSNRISISAISKQFIISGEFKNYISAVNKVGNNVNQLARVANSQKFIERSQFNVI